MRLNFARKFINSCQNLKKQEILIITYKTIILNLKMNYHIRIIYLYKLMKIISKYKLTKIKTRCVISNNSKFLIRIFGLNRIKLKKLLNIGLINGYSKSSW